MTRRSRREIETALDNLGLGDVDGEVTDAGCGVTAPFVTYEEDGPNDPPEGTTVVDVVEEGGATYHVVRQTDRDSTGGT